MTFINDYEYVCGYVYVCIYIYIYIYIHKAYIHTLKYVNIEEIDMQKYRRN